MRLILASASPRRAELLTAAGFTFEVRVTDVDERVLPGEPADAYVRRLAVAKAAAIDAGSDDSVLVIGADTAVIVDDEILGKPADETDAARMIQRLSGRGHSVLTGVSVRRGSQQVDLVEETRVFMRPLSADDVAWYVRSGEGMDKAGAYAIQGLASRFIPRIDGSYSNVVGLPVAGVHELIRQLT